MEADLFGALKDSALDVLEVRADPAGLSNIAYAKIRKQGAGDAKQALSVMLGSSKMAIPKVAYVFDEDVDIWDDHQVKWALAFRFDPIRDTVIIPCMNTMTVDPMIAKDDPPATISKIGFDCTIPWGEKWVQSDFQRSAPFELGDPPAGVSSIDRRSTSRRRWSHSSAIRRGLGKSSCSTSKDKTTAMSIVHSDGYVPA